MIKSNYYYYFLCSFLAAWKIIKTWLPAAAVKKIKFLAKSNIGEYVPEDQRTILWGGEKTLLVKVPDRL